MASEDTTNMFGDLKKKKKKPKVAFAEEPASVDADPTYPPKEPVHDELLGPKTAHEKQAQVDHDANKENEDAENMFGDLKKRKKKKEVVIDDDAVEEVGADELDFSDIKRKKKKKPIPDNLEETPAPPADDEPLDDFSDLKKKKKKKRDIPMDLEGGEAPAEGGDDFSDLKKKPKKKKVAMEDFERQFVDDDEEPIPKPKKSKKVEEKKVESDEDGAEDDDGEFDEVNEAPEEELGDNPFAAGSGGGGGGNEAEPWLGSDRDYTYEELLSRFFRVLHASNPALASSSSKRYTLAPPSIHRDGNKKSVFANIGDICRRMHREPSHVISFLLVEMGTTGSVDGSGRLVIKGKFQQKQIENILRRYIVEYVTCKTCKSPDTILTKETRISFITCESCGSRQSVQPIKAGFQAQVGKRKKAVA